MDYLSASVNITDEDFLAMIGNASSSALDRSGNDINHLTGNTSDAYNTTLSTSPTTTIFHGYPSGYTIPSIIFASVIVTVLMIIIVVGNMLVIIAIATEKALKNIQNWFIASLAVADFFLGLVIMPFSLANELMGYWVFGSWWCDIHSAMDVLLCTASIMNLCLISLDRYWSITKAVEYLRTRTPGRAMFMITAVWIMSALICIPPLLGWKKKRPNESGFMMGDITTDAIAKGDLPQCQLSEDIGYVIYSALGSFYIPSCIMVFVYIKIYFAAKARARRGIRKPQRKPPNEQVTSFTNAKGSIPMPNTNTIPMPHNPTQQIATIESAPKPTTSAKSANDAPGTNIPTVTCDFASDVSTSEAGAENESDPNDVNLKLSVQVSTHSQSTTHLPTPGSPASNTTELQISPLPGRCRALSVGIDTDMVSEFDPSSSDSGVVSRCAVVKPLKFRLCQPIFGKKSSKTTKTTHKEHHGHHQNGNKKHNNHKSKTKPNAVPVTAEIEPVIVKLRDPEKEKRRIARKKEKRATLILGLIMGSFIASWLPFFFLYILTPACPSCNIPDTAFAVAFWLGYMNSALNPAIYTIFNKDFRRAFRRILFK